MIGRTQFFFILTAGAAVLLAGILVVVIALRRDSGEQAADRASKNLVTELAGNAHPGENTYREDSLYREQEQITPVFPLEQGEIFVQAVNADINMDGTYDQICALRQMTDPNIYIVCAIQNPVTGTYTRLQPLATTVTQTRSLLMYLADVTGEQRNSLVYSGINAENHQVLGIFLVEDASEETAPLVSFREILSVSADGSVAIEETPRSEAYNQGFAAGESFPVVSYSSVQSEAQDERTFDQMQRTYRWNRTSGLYELSSERVISARNAGTMVLRQLLEGGTPAFSAFLKGLWYKNAETAGIQQLFFDLDIDEIVFQEETTEEIFRCENISVRRNGIYLVTRNSLISNIRRLIDIEITGVDEIRIRVTDDVRLKIGVGSIWDGTYRKLKNFAALQEREDPVRSFREKIEAEGSVWEDNAGNSYTFQNGVYTYAGQIDSESGKYTVFAIQDEPVMQMKKQDTGENTFYAVGIQENGSVVLREVTPSTNGLKRTNTPAITLREGNRD